MSLKNFHQQAYLIQQRMASVLQQQAEKLSKKGKLLALVVFCAISSAISIYLFTSGLFIGKSSTTGVFDVRSSKLPGLDNRKQRGQQEHNRSSDLKNNNDSLVRQKNQSISN